MENKLPKIIIVVGTTASGKTDLAIELANKYNGEIINADAFQVYKELKIGTARATDEEKKKAKFYLDGEISIFDRWDISEFQKRANTIIEDILSRKKMPIIVGGSNLYIDCLINNYKLDNVAQRSDLYDDLSNEKLYSMLLEKNANLSKKIDANNHQRLVRALQILDNKQTLVERDEPKYNPVFVWAYYDRAVTYKRINERVDKMLEAGWINEVESLLKLNKDLTSLNALKAIGYQQIIDSLTNNTKLDVEKIKTLTRHYAKRQLTWIRNHYNDAIKIYNLNINELII